MHSNILFVSMPQIGGVNCR